MESRLRTSRRPLAVGATLVALGALAALLFHGSSPGPAQPGKGGGAEDPKTTARDTAESPGGEGADEAPRDEAVRREQYTAAFNRKLERNRERVERDCAGNEAFVNALDGADELRDRIIASALATDRGEKTKAEQRDFERDELRRYDAKVCKQLAGQSASPTCKRHFRSCDDIL